MSLHPTITVDVGTTSVKLCAFDEAAMLTASHRLPTPTRADNWGEIYDIEALWGSIVAFIRSLDCETRAAIRRIAITGVGESGGLVRPDLSLASPMILWHDQRGSAVLARLSDQDRRRLTAITGLPTSANYGLSKLTWAVEQAGGPAQARAMDAQWLNIAEYLAARMSGRRWAERSLASRTMALDVSAADWSAEACAIVGLGTEHLPELRAAAEGETVHDAFAHEAELDSRVRVHVAGHDHMVGAVGAGLTPGELLGSTGTTEGVLVLNEQPRLDDRAARAMLANGLATSGEVFTLFASIPTGGSAFQTLQTMLGMDAAQLVDRIAALHERYLAGGIDLARTPLVLPQFRGSPPPTKDPAARGIISGISGDTSADDLIFGCFLGLVLQYRDVLELFDAQPHLVKIIGPASRNPLWLQLKADLLGTPLSVSAFPEVVSRGAQALASGTSVEWETNEPSSVTADAGRGAALHDWFESRRSQWQHLRGMPS